MDLRSAEPPTRTPRIFPLALGKRSVRETEGGALRAERASVAGHPCDDVLKCR